MANYSKFKVYLQPHVAKYLAHYSIHKYECFRSTQKSLPFNAIYFDKKTWFGKLIFNNLEAPAPKVCAKARRKAVLLIWISDNYFKGADPRSNSVGVNNFGCEIINEQIKDYMLKELYWFVEKRKEDGVNEKDSIRKWIDFYKISEELSYETAKKALYRARESFESIIVSRI